MPVVRERERTIYVPYEELEKVFTDDGKGVFLPYKEFLELWQELNLKRAKDETKPPQEGVVSRAEYTGIVEGEVLTIDAKITVESFKEGWLTIPLSRGGILPGVTDVDAGNATLSNKPDGYDLIVPDKGVYELKMKLHASIGRSGGKSRLNLTLPSAAVSRFTATVPGSGWEFEVNPSAAFTSRPAGEKTELSFFFGSGSRFEIAWSKPEAAVALKPLILASNKVTSEVRGGSLATTAAIDLRILRAPVSEFVISVPAGQSVLSVTGDDVKEWKLDGADTPAGGAAQKLTIVLNEAAKEKWSGTVSLEVPLPKLPADAPVPLIQITGAAQDRGDLTVVAEPQLDVIPKAGEGLIQQTAAGDAAAGLVNVSAYRYLKHPAQLSLNVSEAKAQVDVESLTTFTVERDRSRLETNFQYQVRRVGIFDARIQLPAGWTGWEVVGINADAWAVEKNGNVEVLAMKFPKQTLGAASLTLRGQQLRANPTDDVTVPVFTPQNVARHDAKIGVSVHSSLEVNTKDRGSLSLEDVNALRAVIVPNAPPDPFRPGQQISQQQTLVAPIEVMLAFRHRDAVHTPATLSFKPRPPQVNVQVLTLTQVKEQSTLHQWELVFDVGYAAIDKFILAVPKAVAGDIRLVDPQVKEIRKDYQPPANPAQPPLPNAENYALWEVVLRNEHMGQFALSLSHEQPGTGAQTATVELLQVHVPGAFQETGQVAVLKDDNLEIVKATADSMEEIDPRELSGSLQRSGVFLAYKYKAQPLGLKLEIARNAYISVPQAVITHAVLTSAVATDRAQTTEAIYWVKNNAQQFLTVKLPKTARLVSDVFVNGQTQQPMKREGADDLLIRLPSDAASRRAAFPVRFVYEVPSEEAGKKMGWWGGIHIEPPTLLDVTKVLEAHHALYLPESHDYTAFKGAMTLSVRDRGWARFRGMVNALVPAFGPTFTQSQGDWNTVPSIPADQKAAFDFQVPAQGRNVVLHRLGEPAAIDVSFRSRGFSYFLEGVVFFVVLALGVARWKAPLRTKFRYLLIFGLGGILLTGILSPANGQVVKGSVFAAGIMALAWTVCGFFRGVKNWMQRPKHRPPPYGGSGGAPRSGPPPQPERPDLAQAKVPVPPAPDATAVPGPSQPPSEAPPASASGIEFPNVETPDAPKGGSGYEVK
ncbi:hypothetical protein DES53_101214 [Roseimicrobium gellanilyticum]|uniref:Uncharacterized protein n=1 Tax=Roseimicrobium gellanilyticum TaxID=748857 RepID=A0A366HTK5_9BACT|nr:hypothetical protein [Roseimicrobium gellanilyticum]RBP47417.1 hypothetical protein DES53_101214 [Roseimicrobium gellanilyticum]